MAQEAIISNANPTVASAINGLRIFIKQYPPFSRLMTTEIIRKRWAVQPFFEYGCAGGGRRRFDCDAAAAMLQNIRRPPAGRQICLTFSGLYGSLLQEHRKDFH
jgi:hypothetical protein